MKILIVCLGNICRSPMAEGVVRGKAQAAGLSPEVASAGTGGWHVGDPPDGRGQAAALARGYDISTQRARQVCAGDFTSFDLILGMDAANLSALRRMAPAEATARIRRFHPDQDVPDPYYDGGFDLALDLIEDAADALLAEIGDQNSAIR